MRDVKEIIIATKNYYLTKDKSKVVEKGDPEADVLLVAKGGKIDSVVAKAYKIDTTQSVEVHRVSQTLYELNKDNPAFGTGAKESEFDRIRVTNSISAKLSNADEKLSGEELTQRTLLTEGLVNQEMAQHKAKEPQVTIKPQEEGKATEEGRRLDGQAPKQPRNKVTKTIGAEEKETPLKTNEE